MGFSEVQERCGGISPSVLSQRLRDLQEAALLEIREDGRYSATEVARGIEQPLSLLNEWVKAWTKVQKGGVAPSALRRRGAFSAASRSGP